MKNVRCKADKRNGILIANVYEKYTIKEDHA